MRRMRFSLFAAVALTVAAVWTGVTGEEPDPAAAPVDEGAAFVVLAGGCFWCVEADFDKVDGVLDTVSGFSGGDVQNPGYKQVTAGGTGHKEVVKIVYDPDVVSFRTLIDYFFRHVDPLDAGGQFCDRGEAYKTWIFVQGEQERAAAQAAKADAARILGADIVTPIEDFAAFYPAEDDHQDYYMKNPLRYKYYRTACGRDRRVKALWGDAKS
ncbi:MAG: peptide-methionine (S)-S-oxide reductase MsrA [Pseudomonadota bacterium]